MWNCIRCWWCTCNWSCTCTPQEIRQRKIDHWYKVNPETGTVDPKAMWKEIWDLDPKDYEWLAEDDAIALFFKQTGKVAISEAELRKLLLLTKKPENDND
jgi:hypothetical protein